MIRQVSPDVTKVKIVRIDIGTDQWQQMSQILKWTMSMIKLYIQKQIHKNVN